MLLREPPPTQADLRFRVLGFPVRVHPLFWIVTLLLGLNGKSTPPAEIAIWMVAVFVSILVHELGHAVMQRRFGGRPWITLYAFGGLASCDDCDRSTRSQILISLAGPVAGFLFALLIVVLVRLSGHQIGWYWPDSGIERGFMMLLLPSWQPFESQPLNELVFFLLFINTFWGCVNLLPIYPLDGGHISRELCQIGQPRGGIILSLQISALCAGAMAIYGLLSSGLYMALFFGYFAYTSYRTLKAYQENVW